MPVRAAWACLPSLLAAAEGTLSPAAIAIVRELFADRVAERMLSRLSRRVGRRSDLAGLGSKTAIDHALATVRGRASRSMDRARTAGWFTLDCGHVLSDFDPDREVCTVCARNLRVAMGGL
jgi:hypothetical protein